MAFANGTDLVATSEADEPVFTIGIDIMKLHLPRRHTLAGFVDIVSDQVSVRFLRGYLDFDMNTPTIAADPFGAQDHTPAFIMCHFASRVSSQILSYMDTQGIIHQSARTWTWFRLLSH